MSAHAQDDKGMGTERDIYNEELKTLSGLVREDTIPLVTISIIVISKYHLYMANRCSPPPITEENPRNSKKNARFFFHFIEMIYLCAQINKIISMSPKKQSVLDAIARRAHEVVPPGSTILLFGSQARGDARPDSDWDILILLDKDRITSQDHDNIAYPIHMLGWDIDEIINPILFTKTYWDNNPYTPFHQNVEEEAIEL